MKTAKSSPSPPWEERAGERRPFTCTDLPLFGVVILAAGASSRMGRPKALLPWGKNSILGHIVEQWETLGAKQILIVARPNDLELQKELIRLGHHSNNTAESISNGTLLINTPLQRGGSHPGDTETASAVLPEPMIWMIENPHPDRGMFSSIQCAARWDGWEPAIRSYAIALVDQPHIHTESLSELLVFHAANPHAICQPSFDGHLRHPVLLPTKAFRALRISSAPNLKEFLRLAPYLNTHCPINDPGLAFDLDTPQDYERAHP